MSLHSEYEQQTRRSAALHERATEVLPGGDTRSVTYHQPYPSFVEEASGCTLRTVDGEELVDFLNNYTQTVTGHASDPVVDAVAERLRRGNGLAAPTEEAVELGEQLCGRIPSVEQVRFCNSGTEATMNAIRGAMAFTGNEGVLKVHGGYHGTHDTVKAGNGEEHVGIPVDVDRRVHETPLNDPERLKRAFETHDDLACFILEPIMGTGGMIPATREYLRTARSLTEEHDVLLIFDEVMSLRVAPGGAQERYDVTPDLTAVGKLIGGGLPVGAFGGRKDVMQEFHPEDGSVTHSGTFNGNPATMVGGIETLEILDEDAIDRLNRQGESLRKRLREVAADAGVPACVTGDGSLFQVHFTEEEVVDYGTSTSGSEEGFKLFLGMRNQGVFLAPRGMGNLSVPMGDEELDTFVEVFEQSLPDVTG